MSSRKPGLEDVRGSGSATTRGTAEFLLFLARFVTWLLEEAISSDALLVADIAKF